MVRAVVRLCMYVCMYEGTEEELAIVKLLFAYHLQLPVGLLTAGIASIIRRQRMSREG